MALQSTRKQCHAPRRGVNGSVIRVNCKLDIAGFWNVVDINIKQGPKIKAEALPK